MFWEVFIIINKLFLGGYFLFFGLNGYFHFYSIPRSHEKIEKFVEILNESKLMIVVKWIEIISGILLVTNFYSFLAGYMLSPIIFVILFLHCFWSFKKSFIMINTIFWPTLVVLADSLHFWKNFWINS